MATRKKKTTKKKVARKKKITATKKKSTSKKKTKKKNGGREASLANLRKFPKGVSGNPSGRSKKFNEVVQLARQHTEDAINTLVKIMKSRRSDNARAKAAGILLDRGWGKAPQQLNLTGSEGGPIHMTTEVVFIAPKDQK